MATAFHTKVHVHAIKNEMFNRTMAFVLPNGLTKAQVEGRALMVDPAAPCAMKLTVEDAPIVARLEVYEDRGVVTAQFRFSDLLPVKVADGIAVGDTAVGAANGFIKKAAANDSTINFVAEILTIGGLKYAALVRL